MKTEKVLPKETLRLWKFRLCAVNILLIFIISIFIPFTVWLLLPIGVLALFFLIFMFLYLPKLFKTYKVIYDKNCIAVSYGVIIQTTHIMPYSKMVYAKTFSTPVSRRMGLSGIVLKAARSVVVIPEMRAEDAQRLALKEINRE